MSHDETEKRWKRPDGQEIYDEGKNDIPPHFYSIKHQLKHFDDHGHQYHGLDISQYTAKAADLAGSEVSGNIIGFSTDDGCIVRYDKAANDFAKGYPGPGGYIKTLYKPDSGAIYYHEQKKLTWRFRKGKK